MTNSGQKCSEDILTSRPNIDL